MNRIEHEGLKFKVTVEHDEDMGAPWDEHDGHGVVSKWTTRDKRPSEKILSKSNGHFRYYDVAESTKIALADGWGVENTEGKTKGQIAAEAVEKDFEHLRAWCNDEWHWVYVVVELLDTNGRVVNHPDCRASLGGIESGDDDYLDQVAGELASEIAAVVGDAKTFCVTIR